MEEGLKYFSPLRFIDDFCIKCLSRNWSAPLPIVSVYLQMGDGANISLFSSKSMNQTSLCTLKHAHKFLTVAIVNSVISPPFPYIYVVLPFSFSLIFYNWFSNHWKVVLRIQQRLFNVEISFASHSFIIKNNITIKSIYH